MLVIPNFVSRVGAFFTTKITKVIESLGSVLSFGTVTKRVIGAPFWTPEEIE
jgi:hypothetical protein